MGLTNRVQPYCRFAIITMQMMPKISCPQRVASDAVARTSIVLVVVDISFLLLLLVARRHCVPCLRSQPRRYSNKLSTPTPQPLVPAHQHTRFPPTKVRTLDCVPRKLHRQLNKTSPPARNKGGNRGAMGETWCR